MNSWMASRVEQMGCQSSLPGHFIISQLSSFCHQVKLLPIYLLYPKQDCILLLVLRDLGKDLGITSEHVQATDCAKLIILPDTSAIPVST